MTKSHQFQKKGKKLENMGVKDGLVAKKKKQNLKSTPGKAVVNIQKKQQNGKGGNVPPKSSKGKGNKQFSKKAVPVKSELEDDDDEVSEDDVESMEDSDQSDVDATVEKKGVKMFKGLKSKKEEEDDDEDGLEDSDDQESDDDDDDDDSDGEEDESEEEDESTSLKALLGDSLQDEDDDGDFDEEDESDDDEDEDMSDADDVPVANPPKSDEDDEDEDEDEDEDDDEDDDDDDDDDDTKTDLSLKDLLGDSLADDDDDKDFEEDDEEDEDISDDSDEEDEKDESIEEKPTKKPKAEKQSPQRLSPEEQKLKDARTVFVGNVPKDTTQKEIQKLFKSHGKIESIRIRGVVAEDSRVSPKVATITKKMHPKVNSVYVYVVFDKPESAQSALKLNGHLLGENTLRVDMSKSTKEHDQKKSIFLGNMPFDITEDEVRSHFSTCGKIESIRIIKDRKSGLSRGVGYINFIEEDSVTLAMELNNTKLKNRPLRVNKYNPNAQSTKRKQKQNTNQRKKFKGPGGKSVAVDESEKKGNKQKRSQGEKKREKSVDANPSSSPVKKEKKFKAEKSFEGQKSDTKKKSKPNKLNKKKKIMAEKLTSTKKSKTD